MYSHSGEPDGDDLSQLQSLEGIIVAEDQLINLQVIKNQISTLKLTSKTTFCTNGQDAIDAVRRVLEDEARTLLQRPISIMLLDF
jgi:CheY-like chemotaxis protein